MAIPNPATNEWVPLWSTTGGGASLTVQDEGTPLTLRTVMNFVGAGVTVSDDGTRTVVTIPGGGTGGSQTPWLQDIDGNTKYLNNTAGIGIGGMSDSTMPLKITQNLAGAVTTIWARNTNTGGATALQLVNDLGNSVILETVGSTYATTYYQNSVLLTTGLVFRIAVNGAERFNIQTNGYVGIGKNSPQSPLHVQGSITMESGSLNFNYASGSYISGNTSGLMFSAGDTEWMRITSAGKVGIGTTGPGATFDVTNPALSSGSGSFCISQRWGFPGNTEPYMVLWSDRFQAGTGDANNNWKLERDTADGSSFCGQINFAPDRLAFSWNRTEALRIESTRVVRCKASVEVEVGNDYRGNLTYNSGWRYISNGSGFVLQPRSDGVVVFYTAPNGAAGAAASLVDRLAFPDGGPVTLKQYGVSVSGLGIPAASSVNVYAMAKFSDAGQNSHSAVLFDTGGTGTTAWRGFQIAKNAQDFYISRFDAAGSVNATHDLTILSTGKVGIGTVSPVGKLHVMANADLVDTINISGTSVAAYIAMGASTTAGQVGFWNGSGWGPIYYIGVQNMGQYGIVNKCSGDTGLDPLAGNTGSWYAWAPNNTDFYIRMRGGDGVYRSVKLTLA